MGYALLELKHFRRKANDVREHDINRNNHRRCSIKKLFIKFCEFHSKQFRPGTLLKKKLWHRCFPVNFSKPLRPHFLQNTSGQQFLFFSKTFNSD